MDTAVMNPLNFNDESIEFYFSRIYVSKIVTEK